MAKNNLNTVNSNVADLGKPEAEAPQLHLYAGNIMRIKEETGYMLLMVRNADGKDVDDTATAIFFESNTPDIAAIRAKVGDYVSFACQSLDETDMELPRDGTPVMKAYKYVPGSLAAVQRKRKQFVPAVKEEQLVPEGIATRLSELGKQLGIFFGIGGKK